MPDEQVTALISRLFSTNKLVVAPDELFSTLNRMLDEHMQQQQRLTLLERLLPSYRGIIQEMSKWI